MCTRMRVPRGMRACMHAYAHMACHYELTFLPLFQAQASVLQPRHAPPQAAFAPQAAVDELLEVEDVY